MLSRATMSVGHGYEQTTRAPRSPILFIHHSPEFTNIQLTSQEKSVITERRTKRGNCLRQIDIMFCGNARLELGTSLVLETVFKVRARFSESYKS